MLNGNHYDALTGRLLKSEVSQSKADQNVETVHVTTRPKRAGSMMSDFGPVRASKVTANKVHHKTEKSKTLMRTVVKKPVDIKVHAKSASSSPVVNTAQAAASSVGAKRLNPLREIRAQQILKSNFISKFGEDNQSKSHKSAPIIPVAPAPEHRIVEHAAAKTPETPAIVHNPFQSAIDNAKSHEQPLHKKSSLSHRASKKLRVHKTVFNVGVSVIAIAIIGGYFVYNNIPNLAMRVAATRAGVPGNMPSYRPSGFALRGPVQYQPGLVAVQFKSNTDDRNFSLTQRTSNWNSETLLDSFVATDRRQYQTYQDKGKTIYIYGGSNATWVDNGVWYQIEGKSALNSEQLLRIAGSL
ncbi:MAG: hypothetical protein JWL85_20 [Candidatus Saccharibacteria bacterium]|nr:hypothetical protein [Candidatus Saccharibacteria bacterium]